MGSKGPAVGKPSALAGHEPEDALTVARATLRQAGDREVIRYFERTLGGREIEEASDSLACALAERGVGPRDRIAVQLQNMPQFPIALLAAWKLGSILVPINPMYREREVHHVLKDCGARALIMLDELWQPVARQAVRDTDVAVALTTSGLDYLDPAAPRPTVLERTEPVTCDDAIDFAETIEAHRGQVPPDIEVSPDDVAVLVYTSGTTGPPKGSMNLHRNIVFSSRVFCDWCALTRRDVNICIAPLFHITGLVAGIGVTLCSGSPLVFSYRFDPAETLRLIETLGASYTVAAITAFTAMLNTPQLEKTNLSSLRVVQSGGAPVAPAIAKRWYEATGTPINNSYGMTETTAPALLVPIGSQAPVDPDSGALSVGVPVPCTSVEIHDEDGLALPDGEVGELVIRGPQVVPGYWEKPEETARAFPDGAIRTGDVGYRDPDGWHYIIDRKKDLIVASGYKVWPREVEDALTEHGAVLEAAIVGVPDDYRGETVAGYVTLRAGHEVSSEELIEHCRERLAAYKRPRTITIVNELPKTATGKVLRRALRDGDG